MDEVHRAVDTVGGRIVAIKVLPAAAGQHHADRLRRETRGEGRRKPTYPTQLYVAMRPVEGAELTRRGAARGELDVRVAASLVDAH